MAFHVTWPSIADRLAPEFAPSSPQAIAPSAPAGHASSPPTVTPHRFCQCLPGRTTKCVPSTGQSRFGVKRPNSITLPNNQPKYCPPEKTLTRAVSSPRRINRGGQPWANHFRDAPDGLEQRAQSLIFIRRRIASACFRGPPTLDAVPGECPFLDRSNAFGLMGYSTRYTVHSGIFTDHPPFRDGKVTDFTIEWRADILPSGSPPASFGPDYSSFPAPSQQPVTRVHCKVGLFSVMVCPSLKSVGHSHYEVEGGARCFPPRGSAALFSQQ